MPIYEYACEKCGHEFEREQRITDEPVKTCPACRAKKVRRLISRTAFVLKGSGWYSDLYSSKKPGAKESTADTGGKEPAKEAGGAEASSESKSGSESKSESKPESKGSKGGSPSKGKSKTPKAAA